MGAYIRVYPKHCEREVIGGLPLLDLAWRSA